MAQAAVERSLPPVFKDFNPGFAASITSLSVALLEESCPFPHWPGSICLRWEELLSRAALSRNTNVNLFNLFIVIPYKKLNTHLEASICKVRQLCPPFHFKFYFTCIGRLRSGKLKGLYKIWINVSVVVLTFVLVDLSRWLTASAQEITSLFNGLKTADTDYLRTLRNKTHVFWSSRWYC